MIDTEKLEETTEVEQDPKQDVALPVEEPVVAAPQDEPLAPKQQRELENIRNLREKSDRIARERDDAIRELEAERRKSQPQQQIPEEDIEIRLADDDLAEGKHLGRLQKQIRKLERKLEESDRKSVTASAETRLKVEFPDIEKVFSADNIRSLSEQYPELADSVKNTPDLYTRAKATYTLIKKLGIHDANTTTDLFEADRAAAQRNAAKPRPLASVSPQQGDSPMSHANAFANGLTDELKASLHKEMIEAIRNR